MTATNISVETAIRWTAARLTPVGRGAIATIRVAGSSRTELLAVNVQAAGVKSSTAWSGFDSLFQAANRKQIRQQPLHAICFGKWGLANTEELVICRVAENIVEIHCHGGDAAVERVLGDLASIGCEVVDWTSQVAACSDTFEAECQEVLSRTTTWRTTQIVLEQANGVLREAFQRLATLASENQESLFRQQLQELVRWSKFGLRLSSPWNVVLTGRPNVGKSSLINALLGYERAIVFDQPGTTRDVVTGETAFDGWPVTLADTAGLRDNAPELEAAGIALARDRLRTADLRLILLDFSQPPTTEDIELLNEWADQSNSLIIAHKADLSNRWGLKLPADVLRVSSVTGEGVANLQRKLIQHLVPSVPEPGTPIPLTVRQVRLLEKLQAMPMDQKMLEELNHLIGPG